MSNVGSLSISTLTKKEKARIDLGYHNKYPMIESFSGYRDVSPSIAASGAITDVQISQQTKRYPGSIAWDYAKTNGDAAIWQGAQYNCFILTPTGVGDICAIGGLYPIMIRNRCYLTWVPEDERIIFEMLINVNINNRLSNAANWFFGLISRSFTSDYTLTNAAGVAGTVCRRIGFVSANDATHNMNALVDNATNITLSAPFTPGDNVIHHYKFIYVVGSNILFYIDNALVATINTNLPISEDGANNHIFIPIIWNANISLSTSSRIYGVRCYFQNGA